MGQEKIKNVNVQLNLLKSVFVKMLETNISTLEFQKSVTNKEEEHKGLDKWINESKKAIKVINNVKHYEILVSLYNSYMFGKEAFYISLCHSINDKTTIAYWDKSEKGFNDFLKQEQQAKQECLKEYEEKKKDQEFIKTAKQQGKKVEMIYQNGKLKPVIVEEKAN